MRNLSFNSESPTDLNRKVLGKKRVTLAIKLQSQVTLQRSELTRVTCLGCSKPFRETKGFTLLEVVITLGILAMFVGVLGLFPQLMFISADSVTETRAAHIAQQIVRDLVPSVDTLSAVKVKAIGPGGTPPINSPFKGRFITQITDDGGFIKAIDLSQKLIYHGYYDFEGQPVPLANPNARLIAEMTITPETDRSGFCQVEIRVRSLGSSPNTKSHRFVTKIAFPRKESAPL